MHACVSIIAPKEKDLQHTLARPRSIKGKATTSRKSARCRPMKKFLQGLLKVRLSASTRLDSGKLC